MEKNNRFVPVSDIDYVINALQNIPLSWDDPRYFDCTEMRGCDSAKIIENKLKGQKEGYLHLLFTGYRGTGKTTELYRLQARFREEYEVIYYDASEKLDLYNCKVTDLLMAIAEEIHEHMKTIGNTLSEKILKDVADWFFEKVLEKEKSIAAEAGGNTEISSPKWFSLITSKIFAGMKVDTKDREIMRRKLENNFSGLLEKINILLTCAADQLKNQGKKGLIFMIDSLDKGGREGLDKELFIANGKCFAQLKANFIYVVPISLLYDSQSSLLHFGHEILPMIPVFEKDTDHIPQEENIRQLTELIGKRIVIEAIFTDSGETLRQFILTSGGHLRDLLKLLQEACSLTSNRISPPHAEIAVNRLTNDYERIILDDQYKRLVNVYREQTSTNDAVSQSLIHNNVILVYQQKNAMEWKDVHPAVVRNNKFQKALKG